MGQLTLWVSICWTNSFNCYSIFQHDCRLSTYCSNINRQYNDCTSDLYYSYLRCLLLLLSAHHYPIYGVQWHPEKDLFEWTTAEVMKHSYHAVRVTQTAANFFVQEARKSKHHFLSVEEERKSLVYNYNPVYMIKQSSFEQIYEFPCC